MLARKQQLARYRLRGALLSTVMSRKVDLHNVIFMVLQFLCTGQAAVTRLLTPLFSTTLSTGINLFRLKEDFHNHQRFV